MWFYEYKIKFYDEIDYKLHTVNGMVVGETLNEAFDRIVAYYGEQNIEHIEMEYVSGQEDGTNGVLEITCEKEV